MAERVGSILANAAKEALSAAAPIEASPLRLTERVVLEPEDRSRARRWCEAVLDRPKGGLRKARSTACPASGAAPAEMAHVEPAGRGGSHGDPPGRCGDRGPAGRGLLPAAWKSSTARRPGIQSSPACATMPSATCPPANRSPKAVTNDYRQHLLQPGLRKAGPVSAGATERLFTPDRHQLRTAGDGSDGKRESDETQSSRKNPIQSSAFSLQQRAADDAAVRGKSGLIADR